MAPPPIEVHPIEVDEADEAARILFESFRALYDFHRFPGAYASPEFTSRIIGGLIAHPLIWGVSARVDGRVVGSSFIDERGSVGAIGPVSVEPGGQAHGVGRRLTQALLEHAAGSREVRLLQDTFNRSSFALYTSLGFETRSLVLLLAGTPRGDPQAAPDVRALSAEDLEECEALCVGVHGFERTNELRDALADPLCAPLVALRDGRVSAYATTLSYFPAGHAVAVSEENMRELILGASALHGRALSFLVPAEQHALLRWCLGEGLRVVKPMTYMSIGEYRPAVGCWVPSVMY